MPTTTAKTVDDLLTEALLRLSARQGILTEDGTLADADAQWRLDRDPLAGPVTLNGIPLHHLMGLSADQLLSHGITPGELAAVRRLAGADSPVAPLNGTPGRNLRDVLLLAVAAAVLGKD